MFEELNLKKGILVTSNEERVSKRRDHDSDYSSLSIYPSSVCEKYLYLKHMILMVDLEVVCDLNTAF
jgi:hypothetical protein